MRFIDKKIYVFILVIVMILVDFYVLNYLDSNISTSLLNLNNSTNDVYDVVLFWGQSNMIGRCGKNEIETQQKDFRLKQMGIQTFSIKSKIDQDILQKYTKLSHVDVDITPKTVYEFVYTPNSDGSLYTESLKELGANTQTIGQRICSNQNGTLYSSNASCTVASEESSGTNMIPYFGKEYYEKTGHKVIAVYAAIGGKVISRFLPNKRNCEEYLIKTKTFNGNVYSGEKAQWIAYNNTLPENSTLRLGSVDGTSNYDCKRYTYEYMTSSYKAAINYLNRNNMKIGSKFYVVMQGENDVALNVRGFRTIEEYKSLFKEVHNNLKADLGLDYGVIAETSCTVGTCNLDATNNIHNAQLELIKENYDIISGSSYSYDTFIGNKSNYNNLTNEEWNQKKLDAELGRCIFINEQGNEDRSNSNHLNAAGLSQIGKESAISASVKSMYQITLKDKLAIYTGDKIENNNINIISTNNKTFNGAISYTYYQENNCSTILKEVPKNTGSYSVKASILSKDDVILKSNCAKLQINKSGTKTIMKSIQKKVNELDQEMNDTTSYLTSNNKVIENGKYNYTYYTDEKCNIVTDVPKDIGTYYVIAKLNETNNYNSSLSECTKYEIVDEIEKPEESDNNQNEQNEDELNKEEIKEEKKQVKNKQIIIASLIFIISLLLLIGSLIYKKMKKNKIV